MTMMGVLYSKGMQTEFNLHYSQLIMTGVPKCNPYKAVRLNYIVADISYWNILELVAILIGNAIDQHSEFPILSRKFFDYAADPGVS
jgi:hypothetical protein